jgi:hypothetical protein
MCLRDEEVYDRLDCFPMRISPSYFWFVLFGATFVAYQQVQDTLRPNYAGENEWLDYLLGVAPNFFPAVGIPALLILIIPQLHQDHSSPPWWAQRRDLVANAISLVGLISWEFTQTFSTRGRFDWHDVLWTVIGAAVFQLIWALAPARIKTT